MTQNTKTLEQELFVDKQAEKIFKPIKKYNFCDGDRILVKAMKDPTNQKPRCFCYIGTVQAMKKPYNLHWFFHEEAGYRESFTDVQLNDCLRKILRANKV